VVVNNGVSDYTDDQLQKIQEFLILFIISIKLFCLQKQVTLKRSFIFLQMLSEYCLRFLFWMKIRHNTILRVYIEISGN
jgi:hypothetical protein